MTSAETTVCLCMIVKDEAHVIARCLASVRPIVDHWIVVDTGSRDGTQALVRTAMAGVPGEVVERPWVDFAHNRSEALALARPHAAYSLVIDADDELVLDPGFTLPPLTDDSYSIDIHYGATVYRRPQLVRNALAWRYRGVIHEFLECAVATTQGHLPIVMKINHEGARSTDPSTYAKDAAVLERALGVETDPFLVARYTFYLAQSWRDCGEPEKALAAYMKRAELGYWIEEVYVSLLNAGRLMEAIGRTPEDTLAVYARASATCPFRVEAAYAASHLCRRLARFAEGHAIAKPAAGRPVPLAPEGLFVEPYAYEFGIFDELAVNGYWAGHYHDCLDACLRALELGKVPAHELARVHANMRFALDKMPRETVAQAPHAPSVAPAQPLPQASPAPQASAAVPLPATVNLGSGKDYRADCFNIDVDPSWGPDALVDLAATTVDAAGVVVPTARFGDVRLQPGLFDTFMANDVLEHVPNLVALMTSCLALLREGGRFLIKVPFDLSYGAWQDPTHLRSFNERSWLYYTDWFWYLGWREARFVLDAMEHVLSDLGTSLRERGVPLDEIVRTPRAVDAMAVTLRKVGLSDEDRAALARWRPSGRAAPAAAPPPAAPPPAPEPPRAFADTSAEARDRYALWIVTPETYAHSHAFDDVAETLGAAFAALGWSMPTVRRAGDLAGRTPIVLGAHLLGATEALSPDAVIFNFEQIGATDSPWSKPAYLARLARQPLLDYSLANIAALEAAGIRHAVHLPIRGMPSEAVAAPALACDIDVLFYGSINPRRAAILDALRGRCLVVKAPFGLYGAERDALVARAKIVLNMHYYDTAIFEAVRVGPLLAKGTCVVSEGRPDDPDCSDLRDALVLCAYDELVDTCVRLARDPDRRAGLARRARDTIASRTQADIVQALLRS